ncbi:MAG TPA: hypothetical protein VI365_29860 [Trebonia sp.]
MSLLLVADDDTAGITDAQHCWETMHPHSAVRVLTPATLTDRLASLTQDSLVLDGQPWPMQDAVALCLTGHFAPDQLHGMTPGDRAYAAGELTAIVSGLLDRFKVPTLNRPTGTYLAGQGWTRDQWLTLAAAHGLAATRSDSAETVVAQVVNASCLVTHGSARTFPAPLASVLRRLAATGGLCAAWFRLNSAGFDRFSLTDAGVGPRLDLCRSAAARRRLLRLCYQALTAARHPPDPSIA